MYSYSFLNSVFREVSAKLPSETVDDARWQIS
jgi:hypothetical protein